ncbi:MAG: PspC domain-containing protein [Candidatus Neomarinimicrobiota bacterium]|nr:MAG: PspC domain-containing protein [Candidatus Neomarinimicrobiota bacterium]
MKKIYRSKTQKIIGGVCGGFGEYFDIDPVIIRVIWFILLLGGVGLLAYIIAWIIIPIEPEGFNYGKNEETKVEENKGSTDDNARMLLGIILVIVGLLFFMREFWYFDDVFEQIFRFSWRYFLPALLITLGIYIIVQRSKNEYKKNKE